MAVSIGLALLVVPPPSSLLVGLLATGVGFSPCQRCWSFPWLSSLLVPAARAVPAASERVRAAMAESCASLMVHSGCCPPTRGRNGKAGPRSTFCHFPGAKNAAAKRPRRRDSDWLKQL
jgi:hypothetical protein